MSLQAGLRSLEPTGTLLPLIIDIVNVDDALRPVDTSGFKKFTSEQPYDFPNFYVDAPVRVWTQDPISTTAEYQNTDFMRRYLKN
jgi:hypothetical protein